MIILELLIMSVVPNGFWQPFSSDERPSFRLIDFSASLLADRVQSYTLNIERRISQLAGFFFYFLMPRNFK